MKRITWLLLLAALVFVWGCKKPAPKQQASNEEAEIELEEFVIKEPETGLGVLLTEASLLELREDGKMHWKATLNAGDTVIWIGEKRDAPRAYDGLVRTFYLVEFNGQYWIQDYAIAGPAVPAVIIADETVLYTMPDPTAVARRGAVTIPKYAIAAVLNSDDLSGQFVKISARIEGSANPSISELYVKTENISVDSNAVGATKLARIASTTTNPAARRELQKNAMEMAEKSRSFNMIPASLDDDPLLFELELTDNLERLNSRELFSVTSETVNVRDTPSLNGTVVGKMQWGDTFWVTERTKKETTVNTTAPVKQEGVEDQNTETETEAKTETVKVSGVWLRTSEGHWVFSGFTEPVQ